MLYIRGDSDIEKIGSNDYDLEPWVSPWSVWVYKTFHHEPFDSKDEEMDLSSKRPPKWGRNGALPWIVFQRDREIFFKTFKKLSLINISPMMPLLYLFSGGVSMRPLNPGNNFIFNVMKSVDFFFMRLFRGAAMFALIVVQKK